MKMSEAKKLIQLMYMATTRARAVVGEGVATYAGVDAEELFAARAMVQGEAPLALFLWDGPEQQGCLPALAQAVERDHITPVEFLTFMQIAKYQPLIQAAAIAWGDGNPLPDPHWGIVVRGWDHE